ncbi:hypothetical protein CPC08DRAFT_769185 [Agrocybe pediades]|nr:hypothetical protein CPC08DRAFT_769185 [Agrocybe pediades]
MNDKFRQGRWKKLGSDYTSSFGDDLQVDLQRSCLTWISCIESCGVDCMDDRTTELDPLLTALEEFLTGRILGWMHCLAILTGTSPSSKQMQEPLLQRLECWLKRHLSTTSITGVELPLYLLLQDDHSTYSTSETSMEKYISTFIDEVPAVFITSSLERLACKLPELKDCHDLGKMGKSLLERSMGVQTWIDTLFRFLSFCSDRDIWLPGVWQTFHQILSSPIPLSKENAMDNLYCAIFSSFPYPTSLVKDLLLSFLSFGPLFLTEAHEHISLKCVKFTQLSGEDHSQGCPILKVMQELGFVIGRKGKSGDGESFYALSPLLLDSLMNERRCHGTLFPELRKDSIDMAIMTIKVMNDEFRLGRWKNLGSDYTASSGNNLQADLQRSCLTWIFCIESCGVDCMDDRITEFDQLLTTLEEFTAGSILGWMHYLATLRGRSSSKEMQESLLRRLEYWLERHLSMSTSTTDAEKLRMYLLLQDKNHSTSEASKEAYSSTFINIAKEQPVCYRDTEYPTVVYRIDRSWLPNRNCAGLQ